MPSESDSDGELNERESNKWKAIIIQKYENLLKKPDLKNVLQPENVSNAYKTLDFWRNNKGKMMTLELYKAYEYVITQLEKCYYKTKNSKRKLADCFPIKTVAEIDSSEDEEYVINNDPIPWRKPKLIFAPENRKPSSHEQQRLQRDYTRQEHQHDNYTAALQPSTSNNQAQSVVNVNNYYFPMHPMMPPMFQNFQNQNFIGPIQNPTQGGFTTPSQNINNSQGSSQSFGRNGHSGAPSNNWRPMNHNQNRNLKNPQGCSYNSGRNGQSGVSSNNRRAMNNNQPHSSRDMPSSASSANTSSRSRDPRLPHNRLSQSNSDSQNSLNKDHRKREKKAEETLKRPDFNNNNNINHEDPDNQQKRSRWSSEQNRYKRISHETKTFFQNKKIKMNSDNGLPISTQPISRKDNKSQSRAKETQKESSENCAKETVKGSSGSRVKTISENKCNESRVEKIGSTTASQVLAEVGSTVLINNQVSTQQQKDQQKQQQGQQEQLEKENQSNSNESSNKTVEKTDDNEENNNKQFEIEIIIKTEPPDHDSDTENEYEANEDVNTLISTLNMIPGTNKDSEVLKIIKQERDDPQGDIIEKEDERLQSIIRCRNINDLIASRSIGSNGLFEEIKQEKEDNQLSVLNYEASPSSPNDVGLITLESDSDGDSEEQEIIPYNPTISQPPPGEEDKKILTFYVP
ncbi:CLUMA_CG000007, isoform A [Clunio marinus]|uniref:CLUMA_CG000007, isoform A n=1 Tax=Clunio marinus TaxID=568069 RepID=A0A1J1HE80_9DIPT|nr:CLUMA_CG000007, isoform A [Clunio marinus]